MSDRSAIEWTDATWNPVRGCSRVTPGCGGPRHEGGCYAEKIAARFSDPGMPFHGFAERTPHGGRWTGRIALVEEKLLEPLSWKKPRRIFVNSMSDLFHENLPDEAIDRVFAVMALCPQHTFQLLTKRSARMRQYLSFEGSTQLDRGGGEHRFPTRTRITIAALSIAQHLEGPHEAAQWVREAMVQWPLPNVWLGVSAEDQARANERIPDLLAAPAAIRFVSAEPLLGPIDFRRIRIAPDHHTIVDALDGYALADTPGRERERTMIDWIIVGGESGPHSRPMHPAWPRRIRDQCATTGTAFFFKQWGEHLGGHGHDHGDGVWFAAASSEQQSRWLKTTDTFDWFDSGQDGPEGPMHMHVGKKTAGRLLDGREHNDFPTKGDPA